MITDRSDYTAGLRALADLLDSNPDVPLPYDGRLAPISIHHLDGDRNAFLRTVRALPGARNKDVSVPGYFHVTARLAGIDVQAVAYRSDVCERIVVGTREVVREVPDPDALAALPTTTVTETVEDVRWECKPLLADAVA